MSWQAVLWFMDILYKPTDLKNGLPASLQKYSRIRAFRVQTDLARRFGHTQSQFPNQKPFSIKEGRYTLFRIALGLRSILRESNRNSLSEQFPNQIQQLQCACYKSLSLLNRKSVPSHDMDSVTDRYEINYSIILSSMKKIGYFLVAHL